MTISVWEAVGRLAAAALLSGVVGLEREAAHRAAGLRTHMLVGLGAALFTLLSVDAFGDADPARVAAQIVTGVGFLGAGAIFRHGASVTGLTTAAGLWSVAAIGMAAGVGEFPLASGATLVAVAVLYAFRALAWLARGRRGEVSVLVGLDLGEPDVVHEACRAARELVAPSGAVSVRSMEKDGATIHVTVEAERADALLSDLLELEGARRTYRVTPA